jgi:hypothetical protein
VVELEKVKSVPEDTTVCRISIIVRANKWLRSHFPSSDLIYILDNNVKETRLGRIEHLGSHSTVVTCTIVFMSEICFF